jgi:hypothetical protein
MPGSKPKRPPFQFTIRGMLMLTTSLSVAAGLLRYSNFNELFPRIDWAWSFLIFGGATVFGLSLRTWAGIVGCIILCASLGAPIGHCFRDHQGGHAAFGAWLGAVVSLLWLFMAFVVTPIAHWFFH